MSRRQSTPYNSDVWLFHQAQAGCQQSVNALMDRHQGLVQAVVRRQVLGDLPFTEALQAGRIGLWRAILGFDPARGYAFSTYAWPAIQRRVWRAVKADTRSQETAPPAALRPLLTAGSRNVPAAPADPERVWTRAQVQHVLYALVQRLPSRLRYVIVARYGLNGHRPLRYREIGAALGLCGERARQLHTEALVWLRHPAHSYGLRSLLGRHGVAEYQQADARAQRWLRQRGGRDGH